MAYIEFNALSTVLGGSFTARLFLPGLDKLDLNDKAHTKKYPVLWLLHTDGETSLQFLKTPIEALAEQYGFFAIAPDMHHAMGTDMAWGPNYEKFLTREIRGIFKNNLPISTRREENFIGGVGTGGYAALKCACKHPDLYGKGFSLNGILDMQRLMEQTARGKDTGVPQTAQGLEAVFGKAEEFPGSPNDLFALAAQGTEVPLYLTAEENSAWFEESCRLQKAAGAKAEFVPLQAGVDFDSFQMSMRNAAKWLFD